jgi:putative polyketide hydroxylase
MSNTVKISKTPVLIIGSGPAGLTLAYKLACCGIKSTIVERRESQSAHPRAHYINTRTNELFHAWGIYQKVRDVGFPEDKMPFSTLALFGGVSDEDRARFSPALVGSTAQDLIEEQIKQLVIMQEMTEIHYATRFVSFVDNGDRVTVTTKSPDGDVQFDARFLAACDGANSEVRDALGFRMIGDPHIGSVINIYLEGRIRAEHKDPEIGMLPVDRDIKGAFLCMEGYERWCLHVHYDPKEENVEDFTMERCRDIVKRAAGIDDNVPFVIKMIRPWRMTALVAEHFRKSNVFLLGDAAHAFPPTGGFGMNSGIGDAHNLAWKLASYLKGNAGEALLESYEAERLPVAALNTAQSFRNNRAQDLAGHTVQPTPESDAQLAEVEKLATQSVISTAAIQTDENERERIEMIEHFAAIGQELGYAYDQSPVIDYDDSKRPQNFIWQYVPNGTPGARAPYLPLKVVHGDEEVSSLSIIESNCGFTLFVNGPSDDWEAAVEAAGFHDIGIMSIGDGGMFAIANGETLEGSYGIEKSGAVLIRPDGHIAYRAKHMPENPADVLLKVMAVVTGKPVHKSR